MNKNDFIKVRVTPEEKKLIKEFAETHNLTMSEFIRSCWMPQLEKFLDKVD